MGVVVPSPPVLIKTSSTSAPNSRSRPATHSACQVANALPRVPMRIVELEGRFFCVTALAVAVGVGAGFGRPAFKSGDLCVADLAGDGVRDAAGNLAVVDHLLVKRHDDTATDHELNRLVNADIQVDRLALEHCDCKASDRHR